MPRHFHRMVLAELRKVFTRGSGYAALAIALFVGLAAVFGYWNISRMGEGDLSVNGTPLSQIVTASGVEVSGWALWARNFFVLPLFLLLAAASSLGGELGDRTLRELVVRPVSRWSVLAAKLAALSTLSAATLLLTLLPSLGLGTALFGLQGPAAGAGAPEVSSLLMGYAASFLSDVGLLSIAMASSLVMPSVGGTLVAVVLLLMIDKGAGLLLKLLEMVGVTQAAQFVPFTLGHALACWEGWKGGEWEPTSFIGLGVLISACFTIAMVRFQRMDVP